MSCMSYQKAHYILSNNFEITTINKFLEILDAFSFDIPTMSKQKHIPYITQIHLQSHSIQSIRQIKYVTTRMLYCYICFAGVPLYISSSANFNVTWGKIRVSLQATFFPPTHHFLTPCSEATNHSTTQCFGGNCSEIPSVVPFI